MGSAQFNDPAMASRRFPALMRENPDRERFDGAVSVLERVIDIAAVMAAAMLASYVYRVLDVGKRLQYPASAVLTVGFIFAVTFVTMLGHEGAYRQVSSLLRIRETECILRVSAKAFGILFAISFFFSHPFSRWIVVLAAVFVPLLLIAEKQLVFSLIQNMHSRGYAVQNVLIYGAGFTGRQIFSALARSPKVGLNPVAVVDDDRRLAGKHIYESGYKRERSVPVIAGPLTSDMIRDLGVSLIVVGIPSIAAGRLNEITGTAFNAGAKAAFVPQLTCGPETFANYVDIDGVLIASLGQRASKVGYEAAKRALDFCTSLILILLMLPVWAVLAILIRIDSKGPAFFCQTRVGRGGKRFNLYKFRSMKVDAPKFGFHPTDSYDPRITRVGRWLRRTSLDELPQLINILKGEMSLVGPRPEMPFIVERYNERHAERLSVTPGLTGLWQISADRAFLIHENIQYDLYYIRHRNFFMDMAILLHTIVFAMKGL
jgi:exopolysaccharide biosynthesis polyprenyl glycosylphosphotransferase